MNALNFTYRICKICRMDKMIALVIIHFDLICTSSSCHYEIRVSVINFAYCQYEISPPLTSFVCKILCVNIFVMTGVNFAASKAFTSQKATSDSESILYPFQLSLQPFITKCSTICRLVKFNSPSPRGVRSNSSTGSLSKLLKKRKSDKCNHLEINAQKVRFAV